MSHMVIYRGADGKPGYHQTDDIHDAVGFVEQMRNDEGVEHARIFRLEEVVFEYRPYYRVELSSAGTPMMLGASAAAQLPEPESAGAIPMSASNADAVPAPVGLNGSAANGGAVNGSAVNGGAVNGTNGAGGQTGDGTTTGPVTAAMPDSIDLVEEPIDIVDHVEDDQPKADAGSAKKGLFGR